MLNNLESKYYNYELVEYLKGCSIEQLENMVRIIKSNELNKTSKKILSCIFFALENYDLVTKKQENKIIA